MAKLVSADTAYKFVPPHEGNLWPKILAAVMPKILRKKYGITRTEVRGAEKLVQLVEGGHGILLAPNHSRMSDALVLQHLSRELGQPFYIMASSHLFRGSKFLAFVLRRLGAFSVNREGVDREAVQHAIEILSSGTRPLVMFPEGALSQANERMNALMEGVSFIARAAARKREKAAKGNGDAEGRKVFVVPVAIRYLFKGDLEATVRPLLADIERRLSWRPREELPLVERILGVGAALLSLKELYYLGRPQSGTLEERIQNLIDHILDPLEVEWRGGRVGGSVISRVKELRKALLPDMIDSKLEEVEMARRWRQFDDMELAQQLSLYPPKYVASKPTVDRILETVERFSEHLSGGGQPHPPTEAIIQVGDPFEAAGKRDRSSEIDPVLGGIETGLGVMLEELSKECAMHGSF